MKHEPYFPNQAPEIFHMIDFEPKWLLDCGPGTGQEAHRFKERWPTIQVIGFEPSIETCEIIRDEYPGELHNLAVGETEENILFAESANILCGRVHPTMGKVVQCVPLSMFVYLYKMEDVVVWADIEGSELSMLAGAKAAIKSGKIRLLNLEVHDGESESAIDHECKKLGLEKVLSYMHNGSHHDNVYRVKL